MVRIKPSTVARLEAVAKELESIADDIRPARPWLAGFLRALPPMLIDCPWGSFPHYQRLSLKLPDNASAAASGKRVEFTLNR